MSHTTGAPAPAPGDREAFSSRWVFILAAVGSAVGLGNIWRYPYVAFENGGGAFLIPYIVALLTAGIPLLLLDYSLGHRFRGSAPLAFRRVHRWAEPIGWLQVIISFIIAVYYAVVLVWAGRYFIASFGLEYAEDPAGYLFGDVLHMAEDASMGGEIVWGLAIPLAAVWLVTIGILLAGVEKGIGLVNKVVIPLLVGVFMLLVVRALTLEGAAAGLNALFTPDWGTLTNTDVWVAAYGQIFFSLSIAFGIMLTYASFLPRRANLTGSGFMVGFSNSSFELLAAIGVFSCLGFLAVQSGSTVAESAAGGVGLAFVAFPALIAEMPLGNVFGILFFGSLFFAGLTSLISICQVVASAFQEKFGLGRRTAIISTLGTMAVLSMLLFPTTTGLQVLDTTDNWVNNIFLVGAAFVMLVAVAWVFRALPMLQRHLNAFGSIKMNRAWQFTLAILTPVMLIIMLVPTIIKLINEGYGGYDAAQVAIFGWGQIGLGIVLAIVFTLIPWRKETSLNDGHDLTSDDDYADLPGDHDADGVPDANEVVKGGHL